MNPTNRKWIILAGALLAACVFGVCLLSGGAAAWGFLRPSPQVGLQPERTTAPRITPTSFIYPRPTYTRRATLIVSPALTTAAGAPGTAGATPVAAGTGATLTAALLPTIDPSLLTPTGPLSGLDAWCLPWNSSGERGPVVRVIDGVTIEVKIQGEVRQVRYLGVSLRDPSADPNIWTAAYEQNRRLVEGREVLLVSGAAGVDDEGRLLRYVFAGGRFVNYEMVALGYANAFSMPPETRCDALLLEAEARAIKNQVGLWLPTPTATRTLIPIPSPTIGTTGEVVISFISKRGTLWQEPEEFVEIRNDADYWVQLEGWSLSDENGHVFIFPRFALNPNGHCRVYTNEYHPTSCGFSYWSGSPIWSNDRECAYLKNALGELVSTLCYE